MPVKSWKILKSNYVVKDRWMTLRADKCETPGGTILEPFYIQEPVDWVHVVAFDDQRRILLNEQYRHGAGKISTELPCGTVEAAESPLAAITRELMEETGCTFERIEKLPPVSPNPARYTNLIHPFIAFGTKVVAEQNLDEAEDIDFRFAPVSEVMDLIRSGQFLQSLHVSSIMLALERIGMLNVRSD